MGHPCKELLIADMNNMILLAFAILISRFHYSSFDVI